MRLIIWLISYFSDNWVIRKYKAAGARIGEAESYSFMSFMGEPCGIDSALGRWQFWEDVIICRGYRTYSLDQFIKYGGCGIPLPDMSKLDTDEKPVRHALIWKEKLDIVGSNNTIVIMNGDGTFSGIYIPPSTESKNDILQNDAI